MYAPIKVIASFLTGVLVTGVTMGMMNAPMLRADETATDDSGLDLSEFLPDIGRIYREAMLTPFQQAEAQIYDEEIAAYYRRLMENTGLDQMAQELEADDSDGGGG